MSSGSSLNIILSLRPARALVYPDSHPPMNRLVTFLLGQRTCTRPVNSLPAQPHMHSGLHQDHLHPHPVPEPLEERKGHTVTALPQSSQVLSHFQLSVPGMRGLEMGSWGGFSGHELPGALPPHGRHGRIPHHQVGAHFLPRTQQTRASKW